MREIKFRCLSQNLDTNKKEWVYYGVMSKPQVLGATYITGDLQFTGIKDKNGKEIYDGDIVKGNHKDNFIISPILEGLSMFNIRFYGQKHNELIAEPVNQVQTASWLSDSEVIGNIYENSNLLKV